MKLRAFIVGALFCVCLRTGAAADPAVPSHDDSFTKDDLFKANVADLKDTQLVVHPDTPLPLNTNMLWCGTLQLAWNEAANLVGEKLHFTKPSREADLLNRGGFNQSDLDPGSYVAIADFERNHMEDEIRAALEKTFHGAASPELIPMPPDHPGPNDFVTYAYLFKNLAFAKPFSDQTTLQFKEQPVKNFGFDGSNEVDADTRNQVLICDYQSEANFIIKLATKSPMDELILAKIPPEATLEKTIQVALNRTDHGAPADLTDRDRLAVPKLNFDLRCDFSELEGLVLQPTPAAKIKEPLVVTKAEQLVRFQLNEKGAILKSEAEMAMATTAMAPGYEPPSHQLIFDGPFLIMLRQKNATQPYLAMWVGTTSLLIPAAK